MHWSATAEYFDPAAATHRRGSSDLAITRAYAKLESRIALVSAGEHEVSGLVDNAPRHFYCVDAE